MGSFPQLYCHDYPGVCVFLLDFIAMIIQLTGPQVAWRGHPSFARRPSRRSGGRCCCSSWSTSGSHWTAGKWASSVLPVWGVWEIWFKTVLPPQPTSGRVVGRGSDIGDSSYYGPQQSALQRSNRSNNSFVLARKLGSSVDSDNLDDNHNDCEYNCNNYHY